MSIRHFTLDMVPDYRWVTRRHPPEHLLSRVDDPSLDPECQTVDGGTGYLGYVVCNNLGYDDHKLTADKESHVLGIERAEPKRKGLTPRWKISADGESIFIDKRAADQWRFFDDCEHDGCKPFFITCMKSPTLVFIAPYKSVLRQREDNTPDACRGDADRRAGDAKYTPMPYPELVDASRKQGYVLPDYGACRLLAILFGLPEPTEHDASMSESGTSFPEQAICYYLRRDLPEDNVVSRDTSFGIEIDVYVSSRGVGVEYNGSRWHADPGRDKLKRERLEARGVRLLQVFEGDADEFDGDNVTYRYDNGSLPALDRCISMVYSWLGMEAADIDCKRDQAKIYEQFKTAYVEDSLAAWHPEVLLWWSLLNMPLSPFGFKRNALYEAWWRCPLCEFTWQEALYSVNRRLENRDLAKYYGEWQPMECPHCHNLFRFDEAVGYRVPDSDLSLTSILPNADPAEYTVAMQTEFELVSLNGNKPDAVYIYEDEIRRETRHMLLYGTKRVNTESLFGDLDLPDSTLSAEARKHGASWWHCVSCGAVYLEGYPSYLSSPECPICGAEKPSACDIRKLEADIRAADDAELAEKVAYMRDAYARCEESLDGRRITYGLLCDFIMSDENRPIMPVMISYYLKRAPDLVEALEESTRAYEQESLRAAYEECVRTGAATGKNGSILVRDIRNHMPKGLTGNVSKMIKESTFLTVGRHGVELVEDDGSEGR